jgi:hypothetical protein
MADRSKLVQQIQEIKDRAYDKGAAMVLSHLSKLGFKKLTVQIMQDHHLDLEHFEACPPPDYTAIKDAWLHCGMPLRKPPAPEGRPKVSDPRHREK